MAARLVAPEVVLEVMPEEALAGKANPYLPRNQSSSLRSSTNTLVDLAPVHGSSSLRGFGHRLRDLHPDFRDYASHVESADCNSGRSDFVHHSGVVLTCWNLTHLPSTPPCESARCTASE